MALRPQRPYRALRAFVGTVIILTVVGLWAHARLTGEQLGALWEVVMLALIAAAAIAVFGRRTFESAVETSQTLRGEDSDADDADGSDG